MKKKILFASYELMTGHINFDRMQIEALRRAGHHVDLALPEQVAKEQPFASSEYACIIPKHLTHKGPNPWMNRWRFLRALCYIRKHAHPETYDAVIVEACDEITLSLMPLSKEMYIFCHANAHYIDETNFGARLKTFCLRRLGRKNHFLVFNDTMKEPLMKLHPLSVEVVRHGCVAPYIQSLDVLLPIDLTSYKTIVFHPSSVPNRKRVMQLIEDEKVVEYLKSQHILLLLRNIPIKREISSNIQSINEYLPSEVYKQLFLQSDIMLLAYPDYFKYRVSGVSFECVANRKRMLYSQLPSLDYCREYYNYSPSFQTNADFIERLDYLLSHDDARCIASVKELQPKYEHII